MKLIRGARLSFVFVFLVCIFTTIDAAPPTPSPTAGSVLSSSDCTAGTFWSGRPVINDAANDFDASPRCYATTWLDQTHTGPIMEISKNDGTYFDFYSDHTGNLYTPGISNPSQTTIWDYMEFPDEPLYVTTLYDQCGDGKDMYGTDISIAPYYNATSKAMLFTESRYLSWASGTTTTEEKQSVKVPFDQRCGSADPASDFSWSVEFGANTVLLPNAVHGLFYVGSESNLCSSGSCNYVDAAFEVALVTGNDPTNAVDLRFGFGGGYTVQDPLTYTYPMTISQSYDDSNTDFNTAWSSSSSITTTTGSSDPWCFDTETGAKAYFGYNPESGSSLEAEVTMIFTQSRELSSTARSNLHAMNAGIGACDPCPAGSESPPGSATSAACSIACVAGYFHDGSGEGCVACSQGYYSDTSSNIACTQCPAGKNTLASGATDATDCVDCSAGTYSIGPVATGYHSRCQTCYVCEDCAVGTYASAGVSACTDCPVATYASSTRTATCTDCPAGYGASTSTGLTTSLDCETCPLGTYSLAGSACTQCPAGQETTYGQPASSIFDCSDCVSGKYNDGMSYGQTCVDADRGYYVASSGASAQTACAPAQTTYNVGSTSLYYCYDCPSGYYADSTTLPGCTLCQGGTYNNNYSALSCTACPDGEFAQVGAVTSHDCQLCEWYGHPNSYAPAGSSMNTDCVRCPAGKYSGTRFEYGMLTGYESYSDCQDLAAGLYRGSDDDYQSNCPFGTYQPTVGAGTSLEACNVCEFGKYNDQTPLDPCTETLTGQVPGYNEEGYPVFALDCQAGFYRDVDTMSCELCLAGTYSAGQVDVCTVCPGGRLSNVGATNEDECVSPAMNFIFGFAVLAAIIPLSIEYLIHGRNHRVAFLRQERVTKDIIKNCKTVMANLYHYVNRAKAERKRDFSRRIMKTWIFMLWAVIFVISVALFSFVSTMSQVFFRSMIVWKGFHLKYDFTHIMKSCVDAASFILNLPVVAYLFYPAIALFSFFSNFTIDVEAIDITCEGAQAPMELIINLVILSLTVLVIESDYQIFRAITFNSVTDKFFEAITQPCYQAWAFRENGTKQKPTMRGKLSYLKTGILTLLFRIIGGFDLFQSFLQYCMSMVVWKTFVPVHYSTYECDQVEGWEGTDTIIAIIATFQAWILVIPAIYECVKVLVPGLPRGWRALDDVEKKRDPKHSLFHVVKFFSFFAPDLWMATLCSDWVEVMRARVPRETGRNAKTLRDIQEKDNEDRAMKAGHDMKRAQEEGNAPVQKDIDAEDEEDEDGGDTWGDRGMISTKMVGDLKTGNMININELEGEQLPSFRIVSLGKKAKSASGDPPGFYVARPGYSIKIWAQYPIDVDVSEEVYILARVNRKSGRVDHCQDYDLVTNGVTGLCGGRGGNDLVKDLNATTARYMVVLFTVGDPGVKRLETEGLLDAISRCGGSKKIFGQKLEKGECPAYALIGVAGCGAGHGFEKMVGNGKHSVCDVGFEMTKSGFRLLDVHIDEVEDYYILSKNSYLISTMFHRSNHENLLWKRRQKMSMPSYWTLCRLEIAEMDNWCCSIAYTICCPCLAFLSCCNAYVCSVSSCCGDGFHVPSCLRFLAVFFHLGHIFTDIGRRALFITIWKLYKFVTITLGIWTSDAVELMQVHEHARAASVVFEKPIRRKTKKAYSAYRLSTTRAGHVKTQSMMARFTGRKANLDTHKDEKKERKVVAVKKVKSDFDGASASAAQTKKNTTTTDGDSDAEDGGLTAAELAAIEEEIDAEEIIIDDTLGDDELMNDESDDDFDVALDAQGNPIRLRKESKEFKMIQQEELKRKLRNDYAAVLDAVVCCRSTLLQIIPEAAIVSIFACTLATTPIFVWDKHLRKNLPEIFISEPFAEARVQELENIEEAEIVRRHEMTEFDHDAPNPEFYTDLRGHQKPVPSRQRKEIEEANVEARIQMRAIMTQPPRVVNEWMVFMNGISVVVTESRGVNFAINLYKFGLTVGILLSPPEWYKYWMMSAVVILVPYSIVIASQINVMLGRAMDITDTDLHHAFSCVGLGCVLRFMTWCTGSPLNIETEDDNEATNMNSANVDWSRETVHHADSDSDGDGDHGIFFTDRDSHDGERDAHINEYGDDDKAAKDAEAKKEEEEEKGGGGGGDPAGAPTAAGDLSLAIKVAEEKAKAAKVAEELAAKRAFASDPAPAPVKKEAPAPAPVPSPAPSNGGDDIASKIVAAEAKAKAAKAAEETAKVDASAASGDDGHHHDHDDHSEEEEEEEEDDGEDTEGDDSLSHSDHERIEAELAALEDM